MIVKQISFPKQLLDAAEARMDQLGVGFAEYIRHLVMNDTEEVRQKSEKISQENNLDELGYVQPDPSKPSYRRLKSAQIRRRLASLS